MNRVVKSTLLTFLLFAPASVLAQSDVSVYVTGPSLETKELNIKAVEGQNAKSGFQIKPESVVQITQGNNLLVVTEPRNNVDNVKITDESGKITELVNTNGDTFSLSGITPGIYTLDVIANLPNSDNRAAYETILVILQPGQSPQDPTQIIQKVKIVTDVRVTFEDDDGRDRDRDRDPCERFEKYRNICKPLSGSGQCEQGYVKLFGACYDDDAVLDHDTPEECQADPLCREYRERYSSKPNPEPPCEDGKILSHGRCLPICGEGGYEPGELCRDDGDYLTCEQGFLDRGDGKGCVPEEPELPIQPIVPEEPTPEPKVIEDDFNPEYVPEEETEEEEEVEEDDSEEEESSDEEESGGESDGTDSGVN